MNTIKRTITLIAVLVLLLTNYVAPPLDGLRSAAAMQEALTVWHGWQGEELSILEETAANYQANTGIAIDLVQFEAPVLLEKLTVGVAAGSAPDILLGSHAWGDVLLEQGFTTAYCLPGGCPVCEGPNPPSWCQFAKGDFSHGRIDDFLINGRCAGGPCPPCSRPNPPKWCELATIEFESKLDTLQATFAQWVDTSERPFPHGIPVWWDYIGVFANPQWFADRGLSLPTQLTEVAGVVQDFGSLYYDYDRDFFARNQLLSEISLPMDPVPYREAGLLLINSDHFAQLQNEIDELVPLKLADYQPALLVQGAYMNAKTTQQSQALDFMYVLADEETQRLFATKTGHLPVHSEILAELSNGTSATLLEIGKTGLPLALASTGADLYIKDTPLDTGAEPNPDMGPMWVTEDIWVRTTPDPNYQPYPFAEASPPWVPLPHESPEYRDPKFSQPNYVYVRVRNGGTAASRGTERLRLYWAKASTGLSWPTQWEDYVVSSGGSPQLYGAEVTKPRKNAATATQAERNAYRDAVLAIGTRMFPDGVSYWHKQDEVHSFGPTNRHGNPQALISSPAFLPWHRELINRYEILLQEADPTVKLLYWDWNTNPQPLTGFDFFTSSFMGASRGTTIGLPFLPALTPLSPPIPNGVSRNLGNTVPPALSLMTVLNSVTYQNFRHNNEVLAHNVSHVYIGGDQASVTNAAEDPFFFLLHANADRLWAQWQRNQAALSRLDPATTYNPDSGTNLTTAMQPWDGTATFPGRLIEPWTTNRPNNYISAKTPQHASVVSPPIYDTAPLVIPALQPGEAVVMQIPWYPPNPANFASFGGDQGHFCLLARIETDTTTPFGMTIPEGTDVYANTRENNNIAWKNVTVVDNFSGALGLTSILIRNVFPEPVQAGLRFVDAAQDFDPSIFAFGRITVDLKPELFDRWRANGADGQGIERVGESMIRIESPEAFIQNIPLEPDEVFSIDINFELFPDYELIPGILPKWDLLQTGAPDNPEAIIGGQRFEVDLSKLVLVSEGAEWRYLDDGSIPEQHWISPDFDDSEWKMGQADLGFGNAPITTIDGGPADLRHITTYFRHTFEVTDPNFFQSLHLRLKRNDGAVVYLNGTEIQRINLPEGEVMSSTPATRAVDGLEKEVFFPLQIEPALLQQGINVFAVEIHLDSSSSQDLSFGLELYANPVVTSFSPNVTIATPINGTLFQADQVIPITAEALDVDGEILSVAFFADGEPIGDDSDVPYTVEWAGAALGSHRLRVVATDNDQEQALAEVTITVLKNIPPTAQLTQPHDGAVFLAGEAITAIAQASDYDSEVKGVEFHLAEADLFVGPKGVVETVLEPPYIFTIADLAPGHYMLTAIALDEGGATGQSNSVHFEVHE